MTRSPARRRAFSMIEVTVAAAVLAVLSVAAYGSFNALYAREHSNRAVQLAGEYETLVRSIAYDMRGDPYDEPAWDFSDRGSAIALATANFPAAVTIDDSLGEQGKVTLGWESATACIAFADTTLVPADITEGTCSA